MEGSRYPPRGRRLHPRAVIVGALVAVVAFLGQFVSTACAADEPVAGNNRGWTDGNGVAAQAAAGRSSEPSPPSGSGEGPTCTYQTLPPEQSAIADNMATGGIGPPKGAEPGNWVRRICTTENGTDGTVIWLPQRTPVDPVVLARQALNYSPLPPPALGMSPSPDRDQLVNVPTWLWIDPAKWRPVSASASAGGITVTTTATPARVVWDPGDGGFAVTCDGPGTPYDPTKPAARPSCAYTYRRPAERVVLTATVEWSVRWASSAGGGGDLGTVRGSSSVPVRVAESQAINVSTGRRSS